MEKKRLIFETIFVLMLLSFGLYLVGGIIITPGTLTNQMRVDLTPINNSNLSIKGGVYNFTCNFSTAIAGAAGSGAVNNISIWGNFNSSFSRNITNSSHDNTYSPYANHTYGLNITNISDGMYEWGCFVGSRNSSTIKVANYTVTVDTLNVSITLSTTNATWFTNNTLTSGFRRNGWNIRFNANDATLSNCTLFSSFNRAYNSIATNQTIINATNNTQLIFNNSEVIGIGTALPINESDAFYAIGCADSANHTAYTNATTYNIFRIDSWKPNVTITKINSSGLTAYDNWTKGSDVNISFYVNDGPDSKKTSSLVNCSLWGDFGQGWHENKTISVTAAGHYNITGFKLKSNSTGYIYTVACTDTANNLGWATYDPVSANGGDAAAANFTNLSLRVDDDLPSITLTPSGDESWQLGQVKTIKCSASDTTTNVRGVKVTITGVSGSFCTDSDCSNGKDYTASTTGDKTVTCSADDGPGNSRSKSIKISVSSGVEAAGPGGGGGGITPTEEPITATTTGVTIQPFTNQPFDIIVQGTTYPVEVTGVTATTATITTGSSSNSYSIGDTKEIDLNSDGESDIELTLDDISLGRAVFTIKEVEVKIPEEAGVGEEAPEEKVGITKRPGVIIGIVIAIIVILGGLYYFTRKR